MACPLPPLHLCPTSHVNCAGPLTLHRLPYKDRLMFGHRFCSWHAPFLPFPFVQPHTQVVSLPLLFNFFGAKTEFCVVTELVYGVPPSSPLAFPISCVSCGPLPLHPYPVSQVGMPVVPALRPKHQPRGQAMHACGNAEQSQKNEFTLPV